MSVTHCFDPYEVLGIERTATKSEIRARYKKLAIANHPDKLHGLSPEQKKEKEEFFKNVTVAYHVLLEVGDTTQVKHSTDNVDYWRDVWMRVSGKKVWDTFVDVATKYIKRKVHKIVLPVTLEEVWNGAKKKVQLFLKSVEEPVKVVVNCKRYPYTEIEYEANDGSYHSIRITMQYKDHDVYSIDDDGVLYTDVYINIDEHIRGTAIDIPFLDGSHIHLDIPAFHDVVDDIVLDKYNLRVRVYINGIDKQRWDILSTSEQSQVEHTLTKMFGAS